MSLSKRGRLSAVVALAAGSVLVSHLAAGQVYYPPPPPPARMYYSPPMQPDYPPAMAQPNDLPPPAQWNSREEGEDQPARGHQDRAITSRDDREDRAITSRDDREDRAMTSRDDRENRRAINGEDREDRSITSRRARPSADISEPRSGSGGDQAAGTTTPAHVVSLRAGPSGGDAVIGTLRPGMPLDILGTANGWVQVRSSVGTGWAYGSYLASGAGGLKPASPSDVASSSGHANDLSNGPARSPDVAGPAHQAEGSSGSVRTTDVAKTPAVTANAGSPGGGRTGGTKPLGTANPANGAVPPLEANRSGLSGQISSP